MTNIGNKETLAKNLAYYVERCGKTQKELAEIVGVAPTTFNDWMKAKKYPRIDKIQLLAEHFGIKMSDLIEEKITEEQKNDNDTLASIIVRMRTDAGFRSVVEKIYNMESGKLNGVNQMLDTLEAFGK